MKQQMQKSLMALLITFMLLTTFVSANTIEIASDEIGIEGSVYDADTLYPYEGFDTFAQKPPRQSFFSPGLIIVENERVCLGEKLYWTYYATIYGAGAELDVMQNDADLYDEMKNGGPCTVRTELVRKDTQEVIYIGKAWPMMESDKVYKYTSGQRSITYPTTSKYVPGDYIFFIYAQCTLPAQYFSYGYVAHKDIELIDCNVVCPDSFYFCEQGKKYKTYYTKMNNECIKHTETIGSTTECQKEYCLEQDKYWYDNGCHDEEQCTPNWQWGNWGACNPDTETQLRYGNDGCGHSDTQTQSCTPEPGCGDGTCDAGEDCRNCPQDCGDCNEPVCGDGICDSNRGETIASCPADCKQPIRCGDGKCETGETPTNCPVDCENQPFCGDGKCDILTESCVTCPVDCGICKLCTYDSECKPANPNECIDYKCVKGQCAEIPILTEKCIGISWWEQIWNDYKYFVLGGSAIVTLGIGFVVMVILAAIGYWLLTRTPSGVRK